jgi:tyrosyl-tRNA synthetase
MFGKLMSISDDLMWKYYVLLTDLSEEAVGRLRERVSGGALHPKQAKVDLARTIVSGFHGAAEAERAAQEFERRFERGEIDESALPLVTVSLPGEGWKTLVRVIVDAGLAASTSEATRKIQQGGVRINRERVSDARSRCDVSQGGFLLEVGRKAVRIELQA